MQVGHSNGVRRSGSYLAIGRLSRRKENERRISRLSPSPALFISVSSTCLLRTLTHNNTSIFKDDPCKQPSVLTLNFDLEHCRRRRGGADMQASKPYAPPRIEQTTNDIATACCCRRRRRPLQKRSEAKAGADGRRSQRFGRRHSSHLKGGGWISLRMT